MQFAFRASVLVIFTVAMAFAFQFRVTEAEAQSSYFTSQGCSGCHAAPVVATCNGCHSHGTHPSSAKSSINVAGTSNKASYAPGETVTVTLTGGYRTGWFRATLFDQDGVTELARSTGNDSGMGNSATYPATLTHAAPATPGTYTWVIAWYGNKYDASGAAFGAKWTADPSNTNHGWEKVNLPSFTVVASVAAPTISSLTPPSMVQGATNSTLTINGANLTGATVAFSGTGITTGTATISATSISVPVTVAASAATGARTLTVTTPGGSATSTFTVNAAAIPAPTITSVTPSSLVQGAASQTVTIAGANLTGATVSFSNAGVTGGAATVTVTSINLPVSVTAGATVGAGTVTVTTATGSASSAFSITAAAIPAPTISSVTPSSLVQGAASQTVTIAGANLTGATVSFSNAGVTHGAATVTATSISMPVSVTAGATVGAGTVTVTTATGSASRAFSVTAALVTAPNLTVSTLADGSYTNNATLNVSGTATDPDGIKSVTVNGVAVTVNPADGSFSTALTLITGANTITVIATDNAGTTKTDTRVINYDAAAPVLTVSTPADNSTTTQAFVTVSGTVDETSTVTVKDNDGSPQSATMTGNSYSATVNLVPGVNTIEIDATDLAGNTSTAKRTVTYTASSLTLAVTYPDHDITTSKPSLMLQGTVTDAMGKVKVTVTMNGHSYNPRVDDHGSFHQKLTFTLSREDKIAARKNPDDSNGKLYAVTVTATDAAGNSSTVTRNIIYNPSKHHGGGDD